MQQLGKFTLRIDQDHIDLLKKEASREGLSLSTYIRRRLEAHVKTTQQRAFATKDIHGPTRGFHGQKISQMGRQKEAARCSLVEFTSKRQLTSILSPSPLRGGAAHAKSQR